MEEFRQISTSVKEDIETMKGKLTEIQRQAKEEQARLKAFVEGNLFAFLPRTRNLYWKWYVGIMLYKGKLIHFWGGEEGGRASLSMMAEALLYTDTWDQ